MAAGLRRRARQYALQVLYALDTQGQRQPGRAVDSYHHLFELDLDPTSLQFAHRLVEAACGRMDEIDDAIQSASRNWRIDRMDRVDRNILRLATCELREFDEVPTKVVINEAVELAKEFGTAGSPSFVNGLLDRVASQARSRES